MSPVTIAVNAAFLRAMAKYEKKPVRAEPTVEPILTKADPSAVGTAPNPMVVLRALPRGLPSGLVPSERKRWKYSSG